MAQLSAQANAGCASSQLVHWLPQGHPHVRCTAATWLACFAAPTDRSSRVCAPTCSHGCAASTSLFLPTRRLLPLACPQSDDSDDWDSEDDWEGHADAGLNDDNAIVEHGVIDLVSSDGAHSGSSSSGDDGSSSSGDDDSSSDDDSSLGGGPGVAVALAAFLPAEDYLQAGAASSSSGEGDSSSSAGTSSTDDESLAKDSSNDEPCVDGLQAAGDAAAGAAPRAAAGAPCAAPAAAAAARAPASAGAAVSSGKHTWCPMCTAAVIRSCGPPDGHGWFPTCQHHE